jgi:hypothetical protein
MTEERQPIQAPLEGTGEEITPEGEIVPAPVAPTTLFRTNDPALVLTRARAVAKQLMETVRGSGLVVKVGDKDHLTVEAWQTLGAMLGVTPVTVWTHEIDNGWEARSEARLMSTGQVIGAAEAECLRSEQQWSDRDDFALRSMAQTRATSKALASVLRFVATLGGAAGTPAEEMRGDEQPSRPSKVSEKQLTFMDNLLRDAKVSPDDRRLLEAYAREKLTGGRRGSMSKTIEGLKGEEADEFIGRMLIAAKEWSDAQPTDIPHDEAEAFPPEQAPVEEGDPFAYDPKQDEEGQQPL